jgi:hypothetical protein
VAFSFFFAVFCVFYLRFCADLLVHILLFLHRFSGIQAAGKSLKKLRFSVEITAPF